MSRISRQKEGLEEFLAKKKANVAKVMDQFQTRCKVCNVPSGKMKIWHTDDGYLCGLHLPDGVTPAQMLQEKEAQQEHLEVEAQKPKPESYGEWA